jgi:hypothetical protein
MSTEMPLPNVKGNLMKSSMSLAALTGLILILAACTSTSEPGPTPDPDLSRTLVGVWVFEEKTDDGASVYARAAALSGDHAGYEFGEHGGLKVRTPGWCGTSPLSWSNVDGLWDHVGGRLVDIRHAWRGEPREFQLEIVSINSRRLVCRERTLPGS